MKNCCATLLSLLALTLGNTAFASNGGTISFHGAIVNTPCSIPAATWMDYAQHPAAYNMALKARPATTCADATATQTVQVSRYIAQSSTQSGAVVSVVYF